MRRSPLAVDRRLGLVEKHQAAERLPVFRTVVQQVQDDRDGEAKRPQQVKRRQETHAAVLPFERRCRTTARAGRSSRKRPTLADQRGKFLQRLAQVGGVAGRLGLEPAKDRLQLVLAVARRDELAQVTVERRQADGVPLLREEPRQRRGERAGIVAFFHAGVVAAKLHRPREIDQERAAQISLVLEFLDELAVGSRHHLPVEEPDVVAG